MLDELEWETLYVRYSIVTAQYIKDDEKLLVYPVLVLANIEARVPGTGAFTRLLERIRKADPALPVMVENLTSERFGDKLKRLGFVEVYIGQKPLTKNASRHYILNETKEGGPYISGPPSEGLIALAAKAAQQKNAIRNLSPEERDAWAERLARDSVAMGEAEYGPDYKGGGK